MVREFVPYVARGVRDEAEIAVTVAPHVGALPAACAGTAGRGTTNLVILLDEVDKVAPTGARPVRRAARRSGTGAEPRVPRPLPRRRAATSRRSCSSAYGERADNTILGSCRSHGGHSSTATPSREGRHRWLLPAAAGHHQRRSERPMTERRRVRAAPCVLEYTPASSASGSRPRARQAEPATRSRTEVASGSPKVVRHRGRAQVLGRGQRGLHRGRRVDRGPGVATGTAVTGAGGDRSLPRGRWTGAGDEGLILTGELGEYGGVRRTAPSWVLHAEKLGIAGTRFGDGRSTCTSRGATRRTASAGATMATALASLLTVAPGVAHGRDDR